MSDHELQPPYSETAEASVLGAIFVDPGAASEIRTALRPEDFYRSGHSRIFRAICRIHDRGEAVDPVTLAEDLKAHEELEPAGGHGYLAELMDSVPTAANLQYHIRIVEEKARLRRVIHASQETIQDVLDANGNAEAVMEAAERRIYDVTRERNGGGGYQAP